MRAQEYDASIGIETFTTHHQGIGGRLRKQLEDFVVQEIGLDGTIAPLEQTEQEYLDQPGKFLTFFLVKRNLDSIQAIRRLSKTIGVSYKRFSYAGIKDRRAVTSQQVSFYRGTLQDLLGREIPNISILHPHRAPKPIVPGALWGNRFMITVREVALMGNEARNRLAHIEQEYTSKGGILNFFGPQRFGSIRPNTHLVGKQLVLSNFEEAVHILLESELIPIEDFLESSERNANTEDTKRQPYWNTAYGTYERAIKHYLDKHPGDFSGCLRVLPKDLSRLYVHAYQSWIFNKTVSERVKQGISLQQPTIGDFIMPISGEIHKVRMVSNSTLTHAQKMVKAGKQRLVIPIIGYDFEHVEFDGPMREIIASLLDAEKITPQHFRVKELPVLSSRGTFRPLLVNPTNFQTLVHEEKEDTPVTVKFDLPKGSYASIVLREIIKPEFPAKL